MAASMSLALPSLAIHATTSKRGPAPAPTAVRGAGARAPAAAAARSVWARSRANKPSNLGAQRRSWSTRGRAVVVRAAAGDDDLPEEARDSIALALTMYKEGKYEEALVEFERALTLPGNGQKQFKDKPALLSDGEKISALYNISCCHARLDSEYYALLALAGALEAGFRDWTTFFADPEMELVRNAKKTPGLISMFDKDEGEKLFRLQNGEKVIEQRKGFAAFARGDWMWRMLTKTRPPTDEEWSELSSKKK